MHISQQDIMDGRINPAGDERDPLGNCKVCIFTEYKHSGLRDDRSAGCLSTEVGTPSL